MPYRPDLIILDDPQNDETVGVAPSAEIGWCTSLPRKISTLASRTPGCSRSAVEHRLVSAKSNAAVHLLLQVPLQMLFTPENGLGPSSLLASSE
jgi:hypothetical protein